uniref:ribosomal protein S2 n=1 Tax=Paralagenidium karlingii TaxID=1440115 RepID=UPI0026E2BB30|nr:ribosomal protein S2 [Paralagenidium karlingii]WJH17937.1 ribosomal protein S2 [Paralagenidium karlingii]
MLINKKRQIKHLNLINKKNQVKQIDNTTILHSLFKAKNFYGAPIEFFNKELSIFLYGKRHDYFIINLKYTVFFLKRILKLVQKTIKKKKKILVIANADDMFFLTNRFIKKFYPNLIIFNEEWVSGMFTNKRFPLGINKKQIQFVLIFKASIEQKYLIKELSSFKVPIISFINTDEKLKNIKYPVLTNKENIKSLFFLIYLFKKVSNKNI